MFIHSVHPKICSDTLQFMIFDFFLKICPKIMQNGQLWEKWKIIGKFVRWPTLEIPHGRSLIDRITGISRGDQKCPEEYVCVIWCT